MITSINNAEHYTWGSSCDGWHLLKTKEQDIANSVAQKVLDLWIDANSETPPLLKIMEAKC